MTLPPLPTTTVGSFPKKDFLLEARSKVLRGEMTPAQLEDLERKATREVIELQERLGIDVLVDGEQYRGDMAAYFGEHLAGFKSSGLVRSYGNRYYRKPIITGKVRWTRPMTVAWWKYAQGLTQKPVKGMITGPYTMTDWSFDEHYGTRERVCLALAAALHEEVAALEKAGAEFIQIDEPAISVRPEEFDLARRALGIVTKGIHARTITHICYGDFDKIYPAILTLPVDQIDLEMANSGYDLLGLFRKKKFTKEIGLGVFDVHTKRVETVEEIKDGIRRTLKVIPARQIFVDPDCGLKTRTWDEAEAKLKVMVEAVRDIRREL